MNPIKIRIPSVLALICLTLFGSITSGCRLSSDAGVGTQTKEQRVLWYESEPGYEEAFGQPNEMPEPASDLQPSQQGILEAQAEQLRKVEVELTARVCRMLPTDNEGLRHQKFLIRLTNGTTVLVANDLTMGQMVPCHPGDILDLKGEYIWTKRGGVLHWTHHSDTSEHPGGWIRLGSQTYQ